MGIEQIESLVIEQKKRANIINNIAIDFEHIRLRTPKIILAPKETLKPEMKEDAKFIISLIDNVENEFKTLKEILLAVINEC
jgi:hypothetical protein